MTSSDYFFSTLFINGPAGSLLLPGLFFSCGKWGLLSSCGVQASHCSGLLRSVRSGASGFSGCGTWSQWSWLLGSSTGSVVAAHRLSCMSDLPSSGTEPCLLHSQENSLPLSHQGSPTPVIINNEWKYAIHLVMITLTCDKTEISGSL